MLRDLSLPDLYRWSLETLSGRPRPDWKHRYDALVAEHEGRPYHGWPHITQTLRTGVDLMESEGHLAEAETAAVVFALFNHDRVYEPGRADNEKLSAAKAMKDVEDPEARRLILLTQTHIAAPDDAAGRIVVDADMSILVATPEEYEIYAESIAREYTQLPRRDYIQGRLGFLRETARRADEGSLFSSPLLDQRQALQNMQSEIDRLEEELAS